MIKFTKDGHIFITFGERSFAVYNLELSTAIKQKFGNKLFTEQSIVSEILTFCYDWVAEKFKEIIHSRADIRFVFYLFVNHESSIELYLKNIREDILSSDGIDENTLSLNRRILKLALEQTCDVDYSTKGAFNTLPTKEELQEYVKDVEDLMYLGERLFGFAEHLAEQRMMEDGIQIDVRNNNLNTWRKHHYDPIYNVLMDNLFKHGYKKGIVDGGSVKELREQLKVCMNIDYDFAGAQIFLIKSHHSPKEPTFQTIQPEILVQNLAKTADISETEARNFYEGLTISRFNKLSIKDSVYQSHSFKRYMFRPILTLNINGEYRALVGENKWQESIMVMATNGFQWQQAPEEWKKNDCFRSHLERKADEHDKLLEDEVEVILKKHNIFFDRHILSFTDVKGKSISIVKPCGEIDFVFIDLIAKKIIVSDCKYHRAKYEMVGFSGDFSNFKNNYEPKLQKKVKWVQDNLQLVKEHFQKSRGLPDIKLDDFIVEGLFILNTPTFYMLNGNYKAITISLLEKFINDDYQYPEIDVNNYPTSRNTKVIRHPYFRIQ